MPIFSLSVRAEDRELTPPVTAEFDGWSDVMEHAADVCLAIYRSGICDGVAGTSQLVVDGADGSTRIFDIVDDGVAGKPPVQDRQVSGEPGPNLIRCLQ